MSNHKIKSMPRFCYNCGSPLDENQRFCDKCGKENTLSAPAANGQPQQYSQPVSPAIPPASTIPPATPIPATPSSQNVPPVPPIASQQPSPYGPVPPIEQQAAIPPYGQPATPAKKGGIHPAIIAGVVFIATIGIGLWALWPEAPKTRTVNTKNTIGGKVVEDAIKAFNNDDSDNDEDSRDVFSRENKSDSTSGYSDDDIIKKIDSDLGFNHDVPQ